MHGEREHAAAEFGDHGVVSFMRQCSQIKQQLLGMIQSRVTRRLQPSETCASLLPRSP
jgi:hypothetical protein